MYIGYNMRHLDITFDFETCSTAPDAAPMQLAAVAWNRNTIGKHPFLDESFNIGIDLRTCVVEGFSFDQDTVDFWSRQDDKAKLGVTEAEAHSVDTAFRMFCEWIDDIRQRHGADTVCMWCQGQDFDFPILKTIARRFDLKMPVHQHYFRDCRTFILEVALMVADYHTITLPDGTILTHDQIMEEPMRAYKLFPSIPDDIACGRAKHDATYDCIRSSWLVWQAMKLLRQ